MYQLRRAGVDNPHITRQQALPKGADTFDNIRNVISANDWNILVILIDFSDKPHEVEPAFFDSLIFDSTLTSVRDYYREVSYGDLDLVTVHLPSQTGWHRADNPSTYYTTDALGNPNGGFGSYPRNAQKLVEEAVLAVDSSVMTAMAGLMDSSSSTPVPVVKLKGMRQTSGPISMQPAILLQWNQVLIEFPYMNMQSYPNIGSLTESRMT
jgi:hypothetical protein